MSSEPTPSRARRALLWLGAVVTIGLLQFTYHHLGVLAAGGREPGAEPFISEMTSVLGVGILFFFVRALVRRLPLGRRTWPLYVVCLFVFSATHTSMNWGLRALVFELAGLGTYDYGRMPLRYAMELPVDVLLFTLLVAGIMGVDRLRAARERELRLARLEASLAQVQLHNLRLQLQPHFLFNTLHAVSSTMYEDPAAADEILDRLGELLRASLRGTRRDEVPLREELAMLERYLSIMRLRFGPRLQVDVEAEAGVEDVLVPFMCIQPLVENAVRHGNAERTGHGHIEVRARREGADLLLEVSDDGPGAAPGDDPLRAGLGLSATAERLQLLYGRSLLAQNRPEGGFRVSVKVPLRAAAEAA